MPAPGDVLPHLPAVLAGRSGRSAGSGFVLYEALPVSSFYLVVLGVFSLFGILDLFRLVGCVRSSVDAS